METQNRMRDSLLAGETEISRASSSGKGRTRKPRLLAVLAAAFALSLPAAAPAQTWTWMKGSRETRQPNVYGTMGVGDPANTPGSRDRASGWTDPDGNLWLYGGRFYDTIRGDLWKYSPSTNIWTWMSGDRTREPAPVFGTQGVADPANKPGARFDSLTWTDRNGNLWLYGGSFNGPVDDLWKYDRSANVWTWMKGSSSGQKEAVYGTKGIADPANTPGERTRSVAWTGKDGNLWLFSGGNFTANDLWKYDIATNMWTWVSGGTPYGPELPGRPVYGTQGVPAPENIPGARSWASAWTDKDGMFWLFGGEGMAEDTGHESPAPNTLNDLWRYDPGTNLWTWMKGSRKAQQESVSGSKGRFWPENNPGGRRRAEAWTDSEGNFWLFGGEGPLTYSVSSLSELWKYNPASGMWALMDTRPEASFGVQGQASPENSPGPRYDAVFWSAPDGGLWLFGGNSLGLEQRNDLWVFRPATGTEIKSRIAPSQKLHVRAESPEDGYQELIFNYATGQAAVSPYAAGSGVVPFTLPEAAPEGQSLGIFHYDYTGGRFMQALYLKGDRL